MPNNFHATILGYVNMLVWCKTCVKLPIHVIVEYCILETYHPLLLAKIETRTCFLCPKRGLNSFTASPWMCTEFIRSNLHGRPKSISFMAIMHHYRAQEEAADIASLYNLYY